MSQRSREKEGVSLARQLIKADLGVCLTVSGRTTQRPLHPLSTGAPAACVTWWRMWGSTGESRASLGTVDTCNTNRAGRGGTKQCVCQSPGHTPPLGSGRHYTLQHQSNVKFRKPLPREKTEAVKIDSSQANHLLNSKAEHMQPAIHRVIRTRENNDLPPAGGRGGGRDRRRGQQGGRG